MLEPVINKIKGDMNLRLIGVFGYGVVFPIVCVMIALEFKNAQKE